MSRKVYLCGPITGQLYDDADRWRQHAARVIGMGRALGALDWEVRSPLYEKRQYDTGGPLPDSFEGDDAVADEDFEWIAESDAVIAYFKDAERASIGSCVELGYAYALGKPIITVVEKGSVHDHLFVRRVSTIIVPSLHKAIVQLKRLPENPGFYQTDVDPAYLRSAA